MKKFEENDKWTDIGWLIIFMQIKQLYHSECLVLYPVLDFENGKKPKEVGTLG